MENFIFFVVMVKHTEIFRPQFAEELLENVWTFCGVGA